MSLSDKIISIWNNSIYDPPYVPLLYHNNEYMATISDNNLFIRFISIDGQIFSALKIHFQLGNPDPSIGQNVYMCAKINPILCSPQSCPENSRDLFVLNNIACLLF